MVADHASRWEVKCRQDIAAGLQILLVVGRKIELKLSRWYAIEVLHRWLLPDQTQVSSCTRCGREKLTFVAAGCVHRDRGIRKVVQMGACMS